MSERGGGDNPYEGYPEMERMDRLEFRDRIEKLKRKYLDTGTRIDNMARRLEHDKRIYRQMAIGEIEDKKLFNKLEKEGWTSDDFGAFADFIQREINNLND